MTLHIFTDEHESYVAESLEQALKMQLELIGENYDDEDNWHQQDDDYEIMIWIDDLGEIAEHDHGVLVVGSGRDWIEAFGSGFLCSTEW